MHRPLHLPDPLNSLESSQKAKAKTRMKQNRLRMKKRTKKREEAMARTYKHRWIFKRGAVAFNNFYGWKKRLEKVRGRTQEDTINNICGPGDGDFDTVYCLGLVCDEWYSIFVWGFGFSYQVWTMFDATLRFQRLDGKSSILMSNVMKYVNLENYRPVKIFERISQCFHKFDTRENNDRPLVESNGRYLTKNTSRNYIYTKIVYKIKYRQYSIGMRKRHEFAQLIRQ